MSPKGSKYFWELNNGKLFPKITFGVTHINGFENIYNAVKAALEIGYRAFDCSPKNGGEDCLGKTLEELLPSFDLKRSDVMLATKILPQDYGMSAREAVYRSCENLRTDYIDLFLMQWPGGHNIDPESEVNVFLRESIWKELGRLNSRGVIKSIGVCHFNRNHLESLSMFTKKIPAVNQVEFHPKCPQVELLNYCKENHIQLQAVAFKETFHPLLLQEISVRHVADAVNRTPTQVLLKWVLNCGVGVISQSQSPKKIEQNFELCDVVLDRSHINTITAITTREKYLRSSICVI